MGPENDRIQRLEGFLTNDPDNQNLLIDLARAYEDARQPERAIECLEKALVLAPQDPRTRFEWSLAQMMIGNINAAREGFMRLLMDGVDFPYVRYNLAYCYLLQSQPGLAKDALGVVSEEQVAASPQIALLSAQVDYHLGDLDAVMSLLRSLLRHHPDNMDARGWLALALMDAGDHAAAETMAREALALSASDSQAMNVLGYLALEQQRYDEADATFDRLLAAQPENGRAWVGKGLCQMQRGDLVTAEMSLKAGLENMPAHIGSWNALAWCQLSMGYLDAATSSVGEAMALNRSFGETHGTLAIIQIAGGLWDAAAQTAKIATRLDPQSFSGRFAQVLLQRHQGHEGQSNLSMQELLETPLDESGRTLMQLLPQLMKQSQPTGTKH